MNMLLSFFFAYLYLSFIISKLYLIIYKIAANIEFKNGMTNIPKTVFYFAQNRKLIAQQLHKSFTTTKGMFYLFLKCKKKRKRKSKKKGKKKKGY